MGKYATIPSYSVAKYKMSYFAFGEGTSMINPASMIDRACS